MDEPCSALDPTSTRRIEETIAELADEVTIVIVTHNMQQARGCPQQCAFFLAEQGTPGGSWRRGTTGQIFEQPARPPHRRLRPWPLRLTLRGPPPQAVLPPVLLARRGRGPVAAAERQQPGARPQLPGLRGRGPVPRAAWPGPCSSCPRLVPAVMRVDHSHWGWRLRADSRDVVGSGHAFDRRPRCEEACVRFVEPGAERVGAGLADGDAVGLAEHAPVGPARCRRARWGSRRPPLVGRSRGLRRPAAWVGCASCTTSWRGFPAGHAGRLEGAEPLTVVIDTSAPPPAQARTCRGRSTPGGARPTARSAGTARAVGVFVLVAHRLDRRLPRLPGDPDAAPLRALVLHRERVAARSSTRSASRRSSLGTFEVALVALGVRVPARAAHGAVHQRVRAGAAQVDAGLAGRPDGGGPEHHLRAVGVLPPPAARHLPVALAATSTSAGSRSSTSTPTRTRRRGRRPATRPRPSSPGIAVSMMVIPLACAVMRGVFAQAPIGEREAALRARRDPVGHDPRGRAALRPRRHHRRHDAGARAGRSARPSPSC